MTCRGAHTFLVNSFLPMSLMNWCWRAVTSYSIWYPPTQHRNRMRKKTICIRWNAVHACCTRIPATSYEKLQSIRDGLPYRHAVLETLGPGGVKSESRWRQISQGASEQTAHLHCVRAVDVREDGRKDTLRRCTKTYQSHSPLSENHQGFLAYIWHSY